MIVRFHIEEKRIWMQENTGRRISKKELAKIAGCTVQTMSKLTAPGKTHQKTNTDIIAKLCIFFKCNPSEIMSVYPEESIQL